MEEEEYPVFSFTSQAPQEVRVWLTFSVTTCQLFSFGTKQELKRLIDMLTGGSGTESFEAAKQFQQSVDRVLPTIPKEHELHNITVYLFRTIAEYHLDLLGEEVRKSHPELFLDE